MHGELEIQKKYFVDPPQMKKEHLMLEEVCKLGNVEDPLRDPESIDDINEKRKKKKRTQLHQL